MIGLGMDMTSVRTPEVPRITYQSQSNGGGSSGGTLLAIPASVTPGDILIAVAKTGLGTSRAALPAGWTELGPSSYGMVWFKMATGGEAGGSVRMFNTSNAEYYRQMLAHYKFDGGPWAVESLHVSGIGISNGGFSLATGKAVDAGTPSIFFAHYGCSGGVVNPTFSGASVEGSVSQAGTYANRNVLKHHAFGPDPATITTTVGDGGQQIMAHFALALRKL